MTHAYIRTPIRGFLWYQGETNAGRAAEHRTLFPLLIQSWRQAWGDDTLPFYFVQLPDYTKRSDNPNDGGGWAEFRFAQQDTLERVPHTGMAVTLGIGTFLSTIIDFVLVAFVIFLMVKTINRFLKKKEEEAPAQEEPAGPTAEELLAEIRDLLKDKQ